VDQFELEVLRIAAKAANKFAHFFVGSVVDFRWIEVWTGARQLYPVREFDSEPDEPSGVFIKGNLTRLKFLLCDPSNSLSSCIHGISSICYALK
jgi:hypothetical protein